jgi:transcriptional regulator with XRE-family HTH domain
MRKALRSRIFGDVGINPLAAFRVALPGEPSLRDLAKRVGFSYELLRRFELGETLLSEKDLATLAKALGKPTDEIMRRFYSLRIDYALEIAKDARRRLRELGHNGRRGPRIGPRTRAISS